MTCLFLLVPPFLYSLSLLSLSLSLFFLCLSLFGTLPLYSLLSPLSLLSLLSPLLSLPLPLCLLFLLFLLFLLSLPSLPSLSPSQTLNLFFLFQVSIIYFLFSILYSPLSTFSLSYIYISLSLPSLFSPVSLHCSLHTHTLSSTSSSGFCLLNTLVLFTKHVGSVY